MKRTPHADATAALPQPRRWTVAQIGSREHYAVPRSFHLQHRLRTLYTDAWCRRSTPLLKHGPRQLRALAGRSHPDLRDAHVVGFTLATLADQLRHARQTYRTTEEQFRNFIRLGQNFTAQVNRHLLRQSLDPQRDAYFGYDTGCLETLGPLRDRGVLTVVDQIDPGRVEEELVFEEAQRWPGWQALPGRIPDDYYQRLADEWALASLVLVNSDWSRQALIRQGVPDEKIIVVPLAYEPEGAHHTRGSASGNGNANTNATLVRRNPDRPLTVLWLGGVMLRKGIQYLVEAARLLEKQSSVRIIVAGPIQISDQAVASAPKNMTFVGRVTRDRAGETYRNADVFVLPTLSDGFAITQIEAMAHGLPVIATPNCGRVVDDNVNGLIVPASDSEALAAAIARLDADRPLLTAMSEHALRRAANFSIDRYAHWVDDAIADAASRGTLSARQP